jgi:hypothetical protein
MGRNHCSLTITQELLDATSALKKENDQHSLADIHSQHPSKISAFRLTTRNAKE